MSLLRSNELKIYLKDASNLMDVSEKLRTFSSNTLSHTWDAVNSALFIGFRHKFNHRYAKVNAAHDGGALLIASFWNGQGWEEFDELIDETDGFAQSGFIVWGEGNGQGWTSAIADDVTGLDELTTQEKLYWVKIQLSADSSTPMVLEAIKFILSDDRVMTAIFPEIDNYRPNAQANFLPQHELAKDCIVNELKVRKKIAYQEQIKNPDDWMLAASYKAIELILAPIAGDERLQAVKADITAKVGQAMSIGFASLDTDKSEDLEEEEKPDAPIVDSGAVTGWRTR